LTGKVNDRGENALRLSVYKNARERGYSKAQAASMARNVTVNFTRHGTMGPLFNAGWAFFNASVQGAANLVHVGGKVARRAPRAAGDCAGRRGERSHQRPVRR
jgi:hypothetical protein